MKPRMSETRLLKNGKLNRAFLDKPVPLVHKGVKVGSVDPDGTVDLPGHSGGWVEYIRARDIERELKMYGAYKTIVDGSTTAVVVRTGRGAK